jgi:hypothetical protein
LPPGNPKVRSWQASEHRNSAKAVAP